jgi:hypothetical protein
MSESGGTYLYAVVPKDSAPRNLGPIGLEQSEVQSIVRGKLAAVVSQVSKRDEVRPERALLSAHHEVLEEVIRKTPAILPVSFGTIADGSEEVEELLERYQSDLIDQIEKVRGRVEMGVRLRYATSKPDLFEFLVSSSPELQQARNELVAAGPDATRDMKINVGQIADNVLGSLREEYAARIEQTVGNLASERVRKPPRKEIDFADVAFLIGHDDRKAFDDAVQRMSGLFPDSFLLSPSGPNAPYDFVNIHIQALRADA